MSDKQFSYTTEEFKEIAESALVTAKRMGATASEVDLNEGLGSSVSVRKGDIETLEHNRDKGLSVTVYMGDRKGLASTSDLSKVAVKGTVEAAISIAKLTASDAFSGLADPDKLAKDVRDLDLYHPWNISTDEAVSLAKECEQAAFDVSTDISNSEGASISKQEGHFVYANSNDFVQGYASSRHYVSCSVTAGESDKMQRDGWWTTARCATDMDLATDVGQRAGSRVIKKVGARKIKTTKAPVLFESTVASGLLRHFVSAVSGGNLYRKQSFLDGRIGEVVFPEFISIKEKPFIKRGLSSSSFDNEGVQTSDRAIVTDGQLEGLFLSTYSAKKLGLETTGNAGGTHNLFLESKVEKPSFEQLLSAMGTGFLVTDLLGHGTNMVTGDYSRGAAGFWVENGEVIFPVEEVTIAGNLKEMFRSILAVGSDDLARSSFRAGSVLVGSMAIGGD